MAFNWARNLATYSPSADALFLTGSTFAGVAGAGDAVGAGAAATTGLGAVVVAGWLVVGVVLGATGTGLGAVGCAVGLASVVVWGVTGWGLIGSGSGSGAGSVRLICTVVSSVCLTISMVFCTPAKIKIPKIKREGSVANPSLKRTAKGNVAALLVLFASIEGMG